jgi:hypothetical protein
MLKVLIFVGISGILFHYGLAQPVFRLIGEACLFLGGL